MSDKKKKYDDDDGRTVADMSGLDRQLPFGMGYVRTDKIKKRDTEDNKDTPEWESSFTPDERRIYVFAALKAALLIGAVFIVCIGALIALLLLIWS